LSFLQPILLLALPLALLPVIIHLIHMHRRRVVKWAAMMFLLAAQKMNKGLSRLRQILILTARVLAVAAMIFVITRPLAGGLLGRVISQCFQEQARMRRIEDDQSLHGLRCHGGQTPRQRAPPIVGDHGGGWAVMRLNQLDQVHQHNLGTIGPYLGWGI